MPDASPAAAPSTALIVLAAGKGTRMKSTLPKPLHPVAGVPMAQRVLRAGLGAAPQVIAVVVSPETAGIVSTLEAEATVVSVLQDPQRGTGEATRLALGALPDVERAVVLLGDNPLLEARHVRDLAHHSTETGALVTILTAEVRDAAHYGRPRAIAMAMSSLSSRRRTTTRRYAAATRSRSTPASWCWMPPGRAKPCRHCRQARFPASTT
ncbi:MAG: NTP transferase domain-containing protein [Thermomicrobiales bacterium]